MIDANSYVDVKILTQHGQRYIRLSDMADLLRGFANALEPGIVVDAKRVAEDLRIIARQLETVPVLLKEI